jgi:CRP-like cAMP-binding protein
MQEAIRTYLESVESLCPGVTDTELNFLESRLSVSEYKSRHTYISADTIQDEIGFVHRGLLRAFFVDSKGNEITVNFAREKGCATHYSAFISKTPSRYSFQCMEPSVIVSLTYEHIQEAYERYPVMERYGRLMVEQVLKSQQKRIEGFLFATAESRYLEFVRENPDLFNRVSLSHLASYLGIERQTLTRIRQRLAGH